MKSPIFFTSFFSMKRRGSKPFTSPAMVEAKPVVSKCVMGPTPLFPARALFQFSSVPTPRALTNPTPVATTLRVKCNCSCQKSPPNLVLPGFAMSLNVIVGVFHGLDFFGVLIGYFNFERLFKRHHKLDDVQRIGAQIIYEVRR